MSFKIRCKIVSPASTAGEGLSDWPTLEEEVATEGGLALEDDEDEEEEGNESDLETVLSR
jgi:hypothetical protein